MEGRSPYLCHRVAQTRTLHWVLNLRHGLSRRGWGRGCAIAEYFMVELGSLEGSVEGCWLLDLLLFDDWNNLGTSRLVLIALVAHLPS